MAEDDFVLVAGEEWVLVTDAQALIANTLGYETVYQALNDGLHETITPVFEETAWIPPGHVLIGARLVNVPNPFHPYELWIKTGPA